MSEPAVVTNPIAVAAELAGLIESRQIAHLESKKAIRPAHANSASSLDDPCVRRLFYNRTRWQERQVPSTELQSIFGEGNLHEPAVIRLLDDLGFRLFREQTALHDPATQRTGHPEGHIDFNGVRVLAEIKSVGMMFDRLRTVDDLLNGPAWVRRWYGQVQTYLDLEHMPVAVLILKSKLTGMLRVIVVPFDPEYAAGLRAKAVAVNEAIASGVEPPHITNPAICKTCEWLGRVCFPPQDYGQGVAVLADAELAEAAQEWLETVDAAKRNAKAADALKDAAKARLVPLDEAAAIELGAQKREDTALCGEVIVRVRHGLTKTRAHQARAHIQPVAAQEAVE